MTETHPTIGDSTENSFERAQELTSFGRTLRRLSTLDLPSKDLFEEYLRHKWRANHKAKTIEASFTSIMLFLQFYRKSGKSDIRVIARDDLEAFVEHEQDRGLKISMVRVRMASIIAFLHFLM